jgi:hypothetical protein
VKPGNYDFDTYKGFFWEKRKDDDKSLYFENK